MVVSMFRVSDSQSDSQMRDGSASLQSSSFPVNLPQTVLSDQVIGELMDGILILTEQKELIYANDCARRILRQLNQGKQLTNLVPEEVWHLCKSLIESRRLFPNQHWLIESKIFVDSSAVLNARVRWLKMETIDRPCILLSVRDHYQCIKNMAIEESQKYGLTSREREIWLLYRANYTYKQIAAELCITPNTVKKHMKNIYLKQKAI
jgi:DNA-binding CsgD family transcriptional regulator